MSNLDVNMVFIRNGLAKLGFTNKTIETIIESYGEDLSKLEDYLKTKNETIIY